MFTFKYWYKGRRIGGGTAVEYSKVKMLGVCVLMCVQVYYWVFSAEVFVCCACATVCVLVKFLCNFVGRREASSGMDVCSKFSATPFGAHPTHKLVGEFWIIWRKRVWGFETKFIMRIRRTHELTHQRIDQCVFSDSTCLSDKWKQRKYGIIINQMLAFQYQSMCECVWRL